ncbi:MAG: mandelate racemase/muconate lactonizing enzyme family protein [Sporolactobacillus sp.]
MKIKKVELFRGDLPLFPPFTHASAGTVTHLKEVYLKITAENGQFGWGEVRGNCEYVTGDTPERIIAVLVHRLCPLLIGQPALNRNQINGLLNKQIAGNSAARALIDMALFDLSGQLMNQPGHILLGGKQHSKLPSDATIAFGTVDEAEKEAINYLNEGFRTLKLRVGMNLSLDRDRVKVVRKVINEMDLNDMIQFCIDANQSWTTKEALSRLKTFEPFRVDWFEQPVKASDLMGLKKIAEQTSVTIVADESCKSPEDVMQIAGMSLADAVHLKYIKAGTIERLKKMIAIADSAHLPYMLGQMDEGRLATAAIVQIAASAATNHFEVCCFRRVRPEDDPAKGLILDNGSIIVSDKPGLGITMDTDLLTPITSFS